MAQRSRPHQKKHHLSLECSVCLQIYDEETRKPRLLPCGHTFCEMCLTELFNKRRWHCPTCRKSLQGLNQSADDLPLNFSFISLIGTMCQECFTLEEDIRTCMKCKIKLCQQCNKAHQAIVDEELKHQAEEVKKYIVEVNRVLTNDEDVMNVKKEVQEALLVVDHTFDRAIEKLKEERTQTREQIVSIMTKDMQNIKTFNLYLEDNIKKAEYFVEKTTDIIDNCTNLSQSERDVIQEMYAEAKEAMEAENLKRPPFTRMEFKTKQLPDSHQLGELEFTSANIEHKPEVKESLVDSFINFIVIFFRYISLQTACLWPYRSAFPFGIQNIRNIRPLHMAISPVTGNIFVIQKGSDAIYVLNKQLKLLYKFTCLFGNSSGIAVNGEDHVFLSEKEGDNIRVTDVHGGMLYSFGSSGSGKGELDGPRGLAFDHQGLLYVCDSGNNRVQIFMPHGTFVDTIKIPKCSQENRCSLFTVTLSHDRGPQMVFLTSDCLGWRQSCCMTLFQKNTNGDHKDQYNFVKSEKITQVAAMDKGGNILTVWTMGIAPGIEVCSRSGKWISSWTYENIFTALPTVNYVKCLSVTPENDIILYDCGNERLALIEHFQFSNILKNFGCVIIVCTLFVIIHYDDLVYLIYGPQPLKNTVEITICGTIVFILVLVLEFAMFACMFYLVVLPFLIVSLHTIGSTVYNAYNLVTISYHKWSTKKNN